MQIALAQINTTVGDVEGNTRRCVEAVRQAIAQGADLVLLPELALCGYPPQDLAERSAFVTANMRALTELAGASRGAATVVGHLAPAPDGPGNRVANAASLVQDGRVVTRRDKALLPTYDVFDEARYFQPGGPASPVSVAGVQVGVSICEDAWNDPHFWPEPRRYARDPVQEVVDGGAELLVNISASPDLNTVL